jgi:hypothetical protein
MVTAGAQLDNAFASIAPLPSHCCCQLQYILGSQVIPTSALMNSLFATRTGLASAAATASHVSINVFRRNELRTGWLEAVCSVFCAELDGFGFERLDVLSRHDRSSNVEGDLSTAATRWEETFVSCGCEV